MLYYISAHPVKFLGLHLLSLIPPCLMTIYIGYASLILFIPIFGRSGSVVNTDVAFGVVYTLIFIPVTGYLVGFVNGGFILRYFFHQLHEYKLVKKYMVVTLVLCFYYSFMRLNTCLYEEI